jgi:hypothetical protein
MIIAGYKFEGPWVLGTYFNNVPGVYVIFTSEKWLDVGETDKLGSRINNENHERKPDWVSSSNNLQINIAFLGIDNPNVRLNVESQLRRLLSPVCGER